MEQDFTVLNTFNLQGFLVACRAAGVKLSKEEEGETPDGYISLSAGVLSVHLTEESTEKMNIITAKVTEFNI